MFFVSSGQDIQGTSVVANLPVLMRQNPAETLRRVLPKVRVSMPCLILIYSFLLDLRMLRTIHIPFMPLIMFQLILIAVS